MEVTGRTFQSKHRSAGRENGRTELPGAEADIAARTAYGPVNG